jgi:hypothetical protein
VVQVVLILVAVVELEDQLVLVQMVETAVQV